MNGFERLTGAQVVDHDDPVRASIPLLDEVLGPLVPGAVEDLQRVPADLQLVVRHEVRARGVEVLELARVLRLDQRLQQRGLAHLRCTPTSRS